MTSGNSSARAGLVLLSRMIRDNPDLPLARALWASMARDLARELAGGRCPGRPPDMDLGGILRWCAQSCGSPASYDEPGGASAA